MPVFDPLSPKGPAGAALYATASLLSDLTLFQEVSEAADATEALAKISLGIHKPPTNNDQYGIEELKNLMFQANVYPPVPSQAATVRGIGSPSPMTGGAFAVFFRRHVRDIEVSDHTKRNGLFLWFHDYVTAIIKEVIAAAEATECPRLRSVIHECDGAFSMLDEESAQGEYLWSRFFVLWGDEVES